MSTKSTDSRPLVLVLVALAALLLLPLLFMGFGMMGTGMMGGTWGGHMWSDGGMTGWAFLLAVLLRLLFLAPLVAGGYLLYRGLTRSESEDAALEELRLAYARGDLTEDEYEQRRAALERDADSR
jgi:putative membrane protein